MKAYSIRNKRNDLETNLYVTPPEGFLEDWYKRETLKGKIAKEYSIEDFELVEYDCYLCKEKTAGKK